MEKMFFCFFDYWSKERRLIRKKLVRGSEAEDPFAGMSQDKANLVMQELENAMGEWIG